MHSEIKSFCADKKWREAIEVALRLPPGSEPDWVETLVFIGNAILAKEKESDERDAVLKAIIEAFLKAHDEAHSGPFVMALRDNRLRDTYSLSLGELLHRRLGLSGGGG